MGFKEEMAKFDDQAAADADARPAGGTRLRDGRHQAMITEARVEHKAEDDSYTWVVKWANADGSVRKWYNLENEVGRSIAVQDMRMMGHEGKLSELQDWCAAEEPIGLVCEIAVKTKPGNERDFINVYLNGVLGKGDPADLANLQSSSTSDDGGSARQSVVDDDIPF